MMRKLSQMFLSIAVLITLAVATPYARAQEDTKKGKPTVGGQMKEGTKEMGKAGKSLGHNVKHGRIARGGKHFGKHVYHGGKHYAKGTGRAAKKTGQAVKNAAKP